MNRGYTKEWYKNRIEAIKKIVPECAISSDIITGFCSETEKDHQETLAMMDYVKYDFAYMFKYSERPNTLAQRKLKDDVLDEDKSRRLSEIIAKQSEHSLIRNKAYVGSVFEVLVEKVSKRSHTDLAGRTSQNTTVVFPKKNLKVGDYVTVKIKDCTGGTLIGEVI